jgi:hypothetical protein
MKPMIWLLALPALLSAPHLASAYYDPGVQRWINRDPLGDIGNIAIHPPNPVTDPVRERGGVNLYLIVDNEPLGSIDIDGRLRLNVPKDQRDLEWETSCMLVCDNVICKYAYYPSACLKGCYNDCHHLEIPCVSNVLKGPRKWRDILLGWLKKVL